MEDFLKKSIKKFSGTILREIFEGMMFWNIFYTISAKMSEEISKGFSKGIPGEKSE